MRLHLIRHGQTERNKHPEIIGQAPEEPLSDKGKEQAKLLGQRLQAEQLSFKEVYCSPYKRALDTCHIATGLTSDQLTIDQNLREYGTGLMEDKLRHEVITEDIFNQMNVLGMHFAWPEGDSLYDVEQRAAIWLYRAIQKHQHTTDSIGVFTHGMVIKCLLHFIMQFDHKLTWGMDIKNTAITMLDYKLNHWFVKRINDTGHLQKEML